MTSAQLAAWLALAVVVVAVATGYRRFEVAAALVLLLLGVVGVAEPAALFSGFGHPALVTIVSLYVCSQAIIESHLLEGLGRLLETRLTGMGRQVLGLSTVTGLLSAFMNNVGALALVLPTAARMATRSRVSPGRFGMTLAWAAILGGTLTLAGSAPNIIVSTYRAAVLGTPFRMFDFAPHGLAVCAAGAVMWRLVGARAMPPSGGEGPEPRDASQGAVAGPPFAPLATPQRRLCLAILGAAILAVSLGWLGPSVGFGLAAVVLILAGVLEPAVAYRAVDLKVVLFLGSMLGLGRVLEDTGALQAVVAPLEPLVAGMGRLGLLAVVFALSLVLSNVLNNAAAAVLMGPVVIRIAAAGGPAGLDALLMAVAAGSCLALVLPTHQVTLMAMSRTPFAVRDFARGGLALTLACGAAALVIISLVWR